MDLLKKQAKYISKKDGKEHTCYNFFIRLENGKRMSVKPSFKNDYIVMSAIATEITD